MVSVTFALVAEWLLAGPVHKVPLILLLSLILGKK